jgi:pyridoxal phosphate enzyme (YggS family)
MSRASDIQAGLAAVRERINAASDRVGRDPAWVTLIVVTKFFPVTDIRILADLGVTNVGENRHQEAQEKAEVCADVALTWHFIGGLQSNKAAAVAGYADVVHSVDRPKLVTGLSRGALARDRTVDCFLQVSLDPPGSTGRAGAAPEELGALGDQVKAAPGLVLRGLMAVAPPDEAPASAFDRLAEIRLGFLADHPDANWLSAGMSGDLDAAIVAGATHVRVGSAVLGPRPANL